MGIMVSFIPTGIVPEMDHKSSEEFATSSSSDSVDVFGREASMSMSSEPFRSTRPSETPGPQVCLEMPY